MSELILVRHGQTRGFLVDGYVDLTDVGRAQALALGDGWAARAFVPDRLLVGPQPRHVQTLAGVARSGWPAAERDEGLDEHAGIHVLQAVVSGAARAPEALRTEVAERLGGGGMAGVLRAFRVVMEAWATGGVVVPGVESWAEFRSRVDATLDRLCVGGPGATVVAVTSGGFVGAAVASVLGVRDQATALELSFAVENTSVTTLRFSGRRRTLRKFNVTAHLGGQVPETAV